MSIDTINDLPPRVQYVASASQTVFPYPFPIFQAADLVVEVDDVLQTLTTHYAVSGEGDDLGGDVTFVTGLTAGQIVTIYRETVIERDSDFQQNGPMFSRSVNDELDKLIVIAQEIRAAVKRCLRIPVSAQVADADIELLPISNFASKYLTFDANGKPTPADLVAGTITQDSLGALIYPITDYEAGAGCTALNTNRIYPVGHAFRYMTTVQAADVHSRTGALDVTSALQRCLLANHKRNVFLPAGVYSISASLPVYNQNICGDSKEYTTIVPVGNIECFVNSGIEFITGSIRRLTIIYNGGVRPSSSSGNDRKIGVYWTQVSARSPNFFELEDIEIRGAWWAHYDDSGSYACNISRFFMRDCQQGFYKSNGTTFTMNQVIGLNVNKGFYLNNNDNFTLLACANDGATITAGGSANEFISCVAFTIMGFDVESNTIGGNDSALFSFLDCAGTVGGISGHVNAFSESAGYTAYFKLTDSNITFTGCRLRRSSGVTELTMTGNGTFYAVLAVSNSKVCVAGSEMMNPTTSSGTPTYKTFEATGAGSHIQVLNTQYDGALGLESYELKNQIGEFTVTLTGIDSVQTDTLRWRNNSGIVMLQLPTISGTSNATSMTFTPALPSGIRPARTQIMPVRVFDNSGTYVWGILEVDTAGTMVFRPTANGGTFTGSGTKGVGLCSPSYCRD